MRQSCCYQRFKSASRSVSASNQKAVEIIPDGFVTFACRVLQAWNVNQLYAPSAVLNESQALEVAGDERDRRAPDP